MSSAVLHAMRGAWMIPRASASALGQLVRTLKTKSSAKKRFRITGSGLLTFRRSGKHHKMVKRSVGNSMRLGLVGTFSAVVSRRLRNAFFPGL
ncbi:hypothetical protein KFE25_010718 [Diacronema lutheri]|uniref:50S ribosomal protein L35 n=2 Tax=Diacronema lutheri TaxID=2081491 RepID=A0A8J5XH94_DIALT|nr:hypothetical protein KFE25_010718 [Diacronema lutheri]